MPRSKPTDPFTAALHMLARRPYSIGELRRALEKKFPNTAPVREAIARLRELGYLDDRKFAENVASSLARNRAFGRYRVRRELKARLVDYRHIEPALEQTYDEINEHELLERSLKKKVRTLRLPLTAAKLASLCQSLLRRGFKAGDIIKAVRANPALKPVSGNVEVADIEAEDKGILNSE